MSFRRRWGYQCYVGTMLWGELLHRWLDNRVVSISCLGALLGVAAWWLHDMKVMKL